MEVHSHDHPLGLGDRRRHAHHRAGRRVDEPAASEVPRAGAAPGAQPREPVGRLAGRRVHADRPRRLHRGRGLEGALPGGAAQHGRGAEGRLRRAGASRVHGLARHLGDGDLSQRRRLRQPGLPPAPGPRADARLRAGLQRLPDRLDLARPAPLHPDPRHAVLGRRRVGEGDRALREARPQGRALHRRAADARAADPRRPALGRDLGGGAGVRPPGLLPHRHGLLRLGLLAGAHQEPRHRLDQRDHRRDALPRQRQAARRPALLGRAAALPAAALHLRRERDRLHPVRARGLRLRLRLLARVAAAPGVHAEAERVLRAPGLQLLLVRGARAEAHARPDRRGQHPLRDRLPAPGLPVRERAREDRGGPARREALGAEEAALRECREALQDRPAQRPGPRARLALRGPRRGMTESARAPARLRRLANAYLAAVAVFAAAVAAHALRAHLTDLFVDDWRVLDHYQSAPLATYLATPENGHHIPLTLALFALDQELFRGRMHLLVALSLVCLALACALLVRGLRADRPAADPASRLVAGFACFALVWAASCHDLLWGLNQDSLQAVALLLLALLALGRVPPGGARAAWRSLAAAGLAALGATLSQAVGVASWPALVAAAFVRRQGPRVVAGLAAVGAVVVALYAASIPPHPKISFADSAAFARREPLSLAGLVLAFVGAA